MLRAKMEVKENTVFTKEYYERDKRHIGNALHIFFSDGTKLEQRVDFPIGHRKRRAEGMPVLVKKFEDSVAAHYPPKQSESIKQMFARGDFDQMPVNEFMAAARGELTQWIPWLSMVRCGRSGSTKARRNWA